jgi:hypothetical protein
MPIEQAFLGLLKFFFKLIFYWPFKFLWAIGNWSYDKHLIASADAHDKKFWAENAASDRKYDEERRKRNTLYRGLPVGGEIEQPQPQPVATPAPNLESLVREALNKLSPEQRMVLRRKLS